MYKARVLVVDDEKKLVDVVRSYLESSGYSVIEAYDGKTALELFDTHKPDIMILDLMLPDITGEEICKIIRDKSDMPIIMLTAKVEEESILKGLRIGADDYITKPFSPRQLIARVEAVLRRTGKAGKKSYIYSFNGGQLVIDDLKHEVSVLNKAVNLTPNEYKVLMTLAKVPQKTFTREELLYIAFGDAYEGFDRTIDTHVKNLRQKIEADPKQPVYIVTVYGVGYRFGGE